VPANQPARLGESITVVNVPRLTGVGYYAAAARGMREAASELGNVVVKTDGPAQINLAQQITVIDDHVTSGIDGVLFAANDPIAVAPVLRKALSKGINVVGYDSDVSPAARQWFVNRADPAGIAKVLIDTLADEIGEDGAFAIITSTFEAPVQARWIAEMAAYVAKCHPEMTWLGTSEGQENGALSARQVSLLMRRHGAALKGVVTLTNFATPAAAEAVTQAGKCGSVAVVGLATPNPMKPHIASGCVRSVVLWNPVDLGYAALHVLRAAADGALQPGATSLEAGRLGKLRVDGSEVLLGLPFVFTAENINGFDF
jgi:ABC-type sugar transport system substrate-binding protein